MFINMIFYYSALLFYFYKYLLECIKKGGSYYERYFICQIYLAVPESLDIYCYDCDDYSICVDYGWQKFRQGNDRSEEHTSELQSRFDLVCRLLLEKKKN